MSAHRGHIVRRIPRCIPEYVVDTTLPCARDWAILIKRYSHLLIARLFVSCPWQAGETPRCWADVMTLRTSVL